jgi:hypothetical protein
MPRVDEGVQAGLRDQARTPGGHVSHQLRQYALWECVRLDLIFGREANESRRIDERARDCAL